MNKVFLCKVNTEEGDCVKYINNEPLRFECNHYFGGVNLQGATFSTSITELEKIPYKDITTILTEEELNALIKFNKELNNLGYGIKQGDEKYIKGLKLCEEIQPIYDKLNSKENEKLFNKIIEEEKEYLKNEYSLDYEDIEEIFNNYNLEYRDREIIGCIYDNVEELGKDIAHSYGYIQDSPIVNYIDFKAFGNDLVDDEYYHLLKDGRVIYYNY